MATARLLHVDSFQLIDLQDVGRARGKTGANTNLFSRCPSRLIVSVKTGLAPSLREVMNVFLGAERCAACLKEAVKSEKVLP